MATRVGNPKSCELVANLETS